MACHRSMQRLSSVAARGSVGDDSPSGLVSPRKRGVSEGVHSHQQTQSHFPPRIFLAFLAMYMHRNFQDTSEASKPDIPTSLTSHVISHIPHLRSIRRTVSSCVRLVSLFRRSQSAQVCSSTFNTAYILLRNYENTNAFVVSIVVHLENVVDHHHECALHLLGQMRSTFTLEFTRPRVHPPSLSRPEQQAAAAAALRRGRALAEHHVLPCRGLGHLSRRGPLVAGRR